MEPIQNLASSLAELLLLPWEVITALAALVLVSMLSVWLRNVLRRSNRHQKEFKKREEEIVSKANLMPEHHKTLRFLRSHGAH